MKQDISMVRGTTQFINIWLLHKDRTPYLLEDGWVLRLGIKSDNRDPKYLILKEITIADQDESGKCTFYLAPGDTRKLFIEKYKYDIGLQIGEDYHNIIEESVLEIKSNITSHSGGAK